jgi:hypothetical protein
MNRNTFAVTGGEGLEVNEPRHCASASFHLGGELAVTLRLGVGRRWERNTVITRGLSC